MEIATKQTNAGVETACATAEVIEGVSLFADFAKSLQKEVVMQFLPPLVPQILQYLQQKPDHYFLVRDIFCTFYEYTVKT